MFRITRSSARTSRKAVGTFAGAIHQPVHLGPSSADAAVKQDRMKHAQLSLHSASQALTSGKPVLFFADGEIADALQQTRAGSVLPRSKPTALGKIIG